MFRSIQFGSFRESNEVINIDYYIDTIDCHHFRRRVHLSRTNVQI